MDFMIGYVEISEEQDIDLRKHVWEELQENPCSPTSIIHYILKKCIIEV